MEKVIYLLGTALAREGALPCPSELGPELMRAGVQELSLAIDDDAVKPAAKLKMTRHDPPIVAVACLWLHSANDRRAIEAVLVRHTAILAGYLVCESEPLRNPEPATDGERTPGMTQVALLQLPPGMDPDVWFTTWRDDHTTIAIETQSTFAYRQNLVVRPLFPGAPPLAAIVEESFPAAAMTSPHAFYDAGDDDDELARRQQRMWASSKRFVDLATIEVLPLSEYRWRRNGSSQAPG